MAGIGFELKKLFDDSEDTPFGSAKALLFSTAVSIGPWFITATSLKMAQGVLPIPILNLFVWLETFICLTILIYVLIGYNHYVKR